MSTNSDLSVNTIRRLVYWRTPWKTALCLGLLLAAEVSLLYRSIISVFSWCGLCVLAYSASLRAVAYIYNTFFANNNVNSTDATAAASLAHEGINQDDAGPSDQQATDVDISSNEEAEEFIRRVLNSINQIVLRGRDLILITNTIDSAKFAAFLYFLTYVGARFNFLTLVIVATLFSFTLPKIYETFQTEIDNFWIEVKKNCQGIYGHFRMKLSQLPVLNALMASIANLEGERRTTNSNGNRKTD